MTPPLMMMLMFSIMGVLLVVSIAAAIKASGMERHRKMALELMAQRRGWSFQPATVRSLSDLYPHIEVFDRGHSRNAYNLMTAELTIAGERFRMLAGDYTYKVTSSNGKSSSTRTYHLSFLFVHWPHQWIVPDLLIRPEGILDKFKGAIGFDDIDFESEEFSRKFWVKSPSKRFAYDVIHPRMIEFLLASSPAQVELANGSAGMVGQAKRWEPDEFAACADWLAQFFNLWPEFVLQNVRTAAGFADDRHGAAT